MLVREFLTNFDEQLVSLATQLGPGLYGVMFVYVLIQTGFFFGAIAPGNIVVFGAGLAAASVTSVDPLLLVAAMAVGGTVGNYLNYLQGFGLGRRFFNPYAKGFRSERHLLATEQLFAKHGVLAMLLAPFTPFVRCIAPFVAGMARMDLRPFSAYGALGVLLWVGTLVLAGYYFGNLPLVRDNLGVITLTIMVVVTGKLGWSLLRKRRAESTA